MKYFHTVEIRVFLKSTLESEDIYTQAILNFINLEQKRVKITKTRLPSIDEFSEDLLILYIRIPYSKDAVTIFSMIRSLVDFSDFDQSIESRIDEKGTICVRLDKEKFLKKEVMLVEHGSCIHFLFNIAAYPCNKDIAKKVYEEYCELHKNKA